MVLRRRRQRRFARSRRRHRVLLFTGGLLVGFVVLVTAIGFGGAAAIRSSCSLGSLQPAALGHNSFVYAANGQLLGSIPSYPQSAAGLAREHEPASRGKQATVAIEDRRYYQHGGVDYEGIVRALWKADLQYGCVVEGGSTITQHVRTLYIADRERTLERKLKEACLAIKLERGLVEEQDPHRVPTTSTTATVPTASRRLHRRTSHAARGTSTSTSRRCSPASRRRRLRTT